MLDEHHFTELSFAHLFANLEVTFLEFLFNFRRLFSCRIDASHAFGSLTHRGDDFCCFILSWVGCVLKLVSSFGRQHECLVGLLCWLIGVISQKWILFLKHTSFLGRSYPSHGEVSLLRGRLLLRLSVYYLLRNVGNWSLAGG